MYLRSTHRAALLEIRVRVRHEHLELARADLLHQILRVARDVEHSACVSAPIQSPTALPAVRILRLANAQREEIAERVAGFADGGELRGEENLAADLAGKPVLLHFEDHFHHVVVGVQNLLLFEAAALDSALLHQLLHRVEFGRVVASRHRIGKNRRGLLQEDWNEVVVLVCGELRVPREKLGGK